MKRIIFYGDVLGFSNLAASPEAQGAVDALSDVRATFADAGVIQALQKAVWPDRFALSDSVFLVSDDPLAAAGAAADLFFALAYINSHSPERSTLMRAALAWG